MGCCNSEDVLQVACEPPPQVRVRLAVNCETPFGVVVYESIAPTPTGKTTLLFAA